jgi:hypothetical protein
MLVVGAIALSPPGAANAAKIADAPEAEGDGARTGLIVCASDGELALHVPGQERPERFRLPPKTPVMAMGVDEDTATVIPGWHATVYFHASGDGSLPVATGVRLEGP